MPSYYHPDEHYQLIEFVGLKYAEETIFWFCGDAIYYANIGGSIKKQTNQRLCNPDEM